MNHPQIEIAKTLATKWHHGQFRRDGVTPYLEHPKRVAGRLDAANHHYRAIAAAWIHDVLEDTNCSIVELEASGLEPEIIVAVRLLTKDSKPYDLYLAKLKQNNIATMVKVFDMIDNLSDNPSPRQIARYSKALAFLVTEF